MDDTIPLLLEPEQLQQRLGTPPLLVVDLSRTEIHAQYHIPGAVHLEYRRLLRVEPPVGGLLPEAPQLSQALSMIGATPASHIVAYDDEGGGKACRLLWTLEVIGHHRYSLLNGGLHAWANEGFPLTADTTPLALSDYPVHLPGTNPALADRDYISHHLGDPQVALLDARSPQEYRGLQRYAARGGHIPGAVNLEWTEHMDQGRNLRLRPADDLRRTLAALGIDEKREVVTYCQTHHRSAYSWFVLHWLGYRARGYAGSWSEWGNRDDTPVEV